MDLDLVPRQRQLAILRIVTDRPGELSATHLAEQLDLHRITATRETQELRKLGLLDATRGQRKTLLLSPTARGEEVLHLATRIAQICGDHPTT